MKILGNALILLLAGATFSSVTRAATPPTAHNTALTMSFDRASIPSRVIIWDQLSTGYDEAAVGKWERNTLVCQSKTDAKYGACLTVPYWDKSIGLTKIELNFTLVGTSTVASIVVEGRKYHGLKVTGSAEATLSSSNIEGRFTFSIPQAELKKLNRTGTWTATLKQKLMQWPYNIPCTGDVGNLDVGCTNAVELNTWTAKMTLNVTDYGSQQIFLPAFPTSVPSINLNLRTRPGTGAARTSAAVPVLICVSMTVTIPPVTASACYCRMKVPRLWGGPPVDSLFIAEGG